MLQVYRKENTCYIFMNTNFIKFIAATPSMPTAPVTPGINSNNIEYIKDVEFKFTSTHKINIVLNAKI